jgi:hypothetical protein
VNRSLRPPSCSRSTRFSSRASAALAIRDHATTLGLDAKWLRVLVGECDTATGHVTEILSPPPPAAKPAASRQAAPRATR